MAEMLSQRKSQSLSLACSLLYINTVGWWWNRKEPPGWCTSSLLTTTTHLPKSANLSSPISLMRRFCGLTSRWSILLRWMYERPRKSWKRNSFTFLALKPPGFFSKYWDRSVCWNKEQNNHFERIWYGVHWNEISGISAVEKHNGPFQLLPSLSAFLTWTFSSHSTSLFNVKTP